MESSQPWSIDYFDVKFMKPDPWKYLTSPYERTKYQRQLDIIKDRYPDPQNILEIGCAEGAQTLLLAKRFPEARITSVEISSNAFRRAKDNLKQYADRITLVNADILEYQAQLEENYYDVIVWSESIYYLGGRLSLTTMYCILGRVLSKLKAGGLLIMANTVDLPEAIPESAVTKRPLIDCYYVILSSLINSVSKSTYLEEKLGKMYEYQIWVFKR
jgi:trans-aconitate methyltransferase